MDPQSVVKLERNSASLRICNRYTAGGARSHGTEPFTRGVWAKSSSLVARLIRGGGHLAGIQTFEDSAAGGSAPSSTFGVRTILCVGKKWLLVGFLL